MSHLQIQASTLLLLAEIYVNDEVHLILPLRIPLKVSLR